LIRKVGKVILLIPREDVWTVFKDSLDHFPEDFMAEGRVQPPAQVREQMFPQT
jgi:antitoxin VapB